jgi:hypothetical protein
MKDNCINIEEIFGNNNDIYYIWDVVKIKIPKDKYEKIKIHEFELKFFLNSRRLSFDGENYIIDLKNLFGNLKVKYEDKEKNIRVVPYKIFLRNEEEHKSKNKNFLKECWNFICENIIGRDIKDLLYFLITASYKDLKSFLNLKIIEDKGIAIKDFLLVFLEVITNKLQNYIDNLFKTGIVHREVLHFQEKYGSTLILSVNNIISPYKMYIVQKKEFNTLPNQMIFQSVYFSLLLINRLQDVLKKEEKRIEMIDRIENIRNNLIKILDKYGLWHFYNQNILNLNVLKQKVAFQAEQIYKNVFDIYKDIVLILLSKENLAYIEDGISYPILDFSLIYELWTISLIRKALSELNLKEEKIEIRKTERYKKKYRYKIKMIATFLGKNGKKIGLLWEVKFNPIIDSLYFSSRPIKDILSKSEFPIRIKPDIVILSERNNKKNIIYLGEIKYEKNEKIQTPKVGDIYKLVGYLVDLQKSGIIEGSKKIEGLIVYPGFFERIKIPVVIKSKKSKKYKIFFVNVIPVNKEKNIENILNTFKYLKNI